jgi:cell fate (sporulation/competence/biofilm development) regulator YlbF (YheA/YmcA/DUF963 family)
MDPRIVELAERLGKAMAEAEQIRKFKALGAELAGDKDAVALIKARNEQELLIARKEQARQPIEVEDKRKLRELTEKVSQHDKLKAYLAAQADYMELIQQVNDTLGRHLAGPEAETPKA